jgi:hypothetical protein
MPAPVRIESELSRILAAHPRRELDPALIIRMLDFTEDMLPNVRMNRRANTQRFIEGA